MTDDEGGDGSGRPDEHSDVHELLDHLEELEATVDSPEERDQVRRTMRAASRLPGSAFVTERIQKYTTRDVAEAFVGSILIAMPMLVEDGVFVIAEHLVSGRVAGLPVYFAANVGFVVVMTVGLLYWADFRQVQITNPILGVIPRRLLGVLVISLVASVALMAMWGRLWLGDPSPLELAARVTVLWTAAAFGAALGDILPGESEGHDITMENLDDIVLPDED